MNKIFYILRATLQREESHLEHQPVDLDVVVAGEVSVLVRLKILEKVGSDHGADGRILHWSVRVGTDNVLVCSSWGG